MGAGAFQPVHAQQAGIKTNLLYWATATPNVGLEWSLAPATPFRPPSGTTPSTFPTVQIPTASPPTPNLHHWLVMPEAKYWFCRAFERGYVGLHAPLRAV